MKPSLYTHQRESTTFLTQTPRAFVTDDPGTGKTASVLEAYTQTRQGKLLAIAPLSILEPSWGSDIRRFTDFSYIVAHGRKREAAMRSGCHIVVTNHDAVKWIANDPSLLEGFSHVVVDEFTAFKHHTSQRGKALKTITDACPYVWMLSGTPNGNTALNLWYPTFLLDGGQRFGRSFYRFRSQVCEPTQVGPDSNQIRWDDKEGAEEWIADSLKDITVRHRFEECVDIPQNAVRDIQLEMPTWLKQNYQTFEKTSFLETDKGIITAIHAGARVKKLLQLLSGAVYNKAGQAIKVHSERYELVMDLIGAREQCVVAYNWHHEVDALTQFAKKRGISFGVINGSVSKNGRANIVNDFQAGGLKVIFAHPQSASHGLTLTAGTTTIWCSPTYNAELYQQFNRRIYRTGQWRKTETLRIAYRDSKEIDVYEKLDGKLGRMEDLLTLFQAFTGAAA